jgi:superfamily II DNA/RNA helicase
MSGFYLAPVQCAPLLAPRERRLPPSGASLPINAARINEERMSTFTDLGLHERLVKALDDLALKTPTPIQTALIPAALSHRDVQASAETGSGKTAAYLLPILQGILNKPAPNTATRALILVPTRELALQVEKHCRDLAAFTQINSHAVVGGVPYGEQKAAIRKNPEILVGTPGRVLEHVQQRSIVLRDLEYLVLDEADRMLDMGFREEVLMVVRACPKERQTFLLSATLVHQGLGRIAEEVLQEPEVVAIGTHRSKHASITQQRILADDPGHKQQLANWLLANTEYDKALVFTNMREHAEQLAGFLQSQRDGKAGNKVWDRADKKRTRVACLHGEMPQDERKKLMHWFRAGVVKVLVSTDLAARGLDVKGVDLVINFAMARSGDDYVHRIGRTGRAGEQGLAVSLIGPQEWNLMQSIERYLGVTFEPRTIAGLESRFKGPGKKSPDKKKDKDKDKHDKKEKREIPKAQQRHAYKKNIGKRRQPSGTHLPEGTRAEAAKSDRPTLSVPKPAPKPVSSPLDQMERSGMAPLKRKPVPDKPAQWEQREPEPAMQEQRVPREKPARREAVQRDQPASARPAAKVWPVRDAVPAKAKPAKARPVKDETPKTKPAKAAKEKVVKAKPLKTKVVKEKEAAKAKPARRGKEEQQMTLFGEE